MIFHRRIAHEPKLRYKIIVDYSQLGIQKLLHYKLNYLQVYNLLFFKTVFCISIIDIDLKQLSCVVFSS